MRNSSMILALALGLSALNTFAQNEPAPGDRQVGPPPRHSDSRPGQERRFDKENQDRPDFRDNRIAHRAIGEKRGPENMRPLDGGRGRMERMDADRPAPRFRGLGGPGAPEGQFERGEGPRQTGRDMAFGPGKKAPKRFSPKWSFCPYCGHELKPAMDQVGPGMSAGIRHDGPGATPAMGPGRRDNEGAPRGEFRPAPRGPKNQGPGERRGQDDAGGKPDAPAHRPAVPADDAAQ